MARRKTGKRKTPAKKIPRPWNSRAGKLLLCLLAALILAVVALDVMVRYKFDGSKWSLPAHVYARPLELYDGLHLDPEHLRWELLALGYKEAARAGAPGQFSRWKNRFDIHSRGFRFWDSDEPPHRFSLEFRGNRISDLQVGSNRSESPIRLEPLLIGGIYPDHLEDRELVRLSELPPYFADALVALEDRNFYQHHGISLRGIVRAMLRNIKAGSVVQGGSTITQQLVKNFYLTQERSLWRKGVEAIMALLLEVHYSKGEILETYINEVYMGQAGKRSIHGFALASRHYFRQPLQELQLHQVALLVGLVKGASYYNPWRHPERARLRRNLVLEVMREEGLIEASQATKAGNKPLSIVAEPGKSLNDYPSYMDLVRRQLRVDYRESDLQSAGLRIFTAFDPEIQRRVEDRMSRRIAHLEKGYKQPENSLQGAAVVVSVGSGEVQAVAGNRHARSAGFNRALDAIRPVGSTIKPAVYLAALERPDRYTLSTLLDDAPLSVKLENGQVWQPKNFERRSHGQVPLYEALGKSYNQATARLGLDLGLPAVVGVLERLGLHHDISPLPSILLGAINLSPLEVAEMYHTLASDGFYTPLRAIRDVYTVDNQPLRRYPYRVEQRFDPAVIHLLKYALQVVVREGTGSSVYSQLPFSLVVAGKTGSSNEQRDSWFSGFSGNHLTVVWLGRDDNGKTPFTGATGALRVWADIMLDIDNEAMPFVQPEGVQYHWVEPQSGRLSGKNCEGARYLPYIEGSEPKLRAPCVGQIRRHFRDWLENIFQ